MDGRRGQRAVQFDLFGEQLRAHEELLRVAGGLAAFSGFYFAIAMLTDSTYREEFLTSSPTRCATTFKRARRVPAAAGAWAPA